jgi:HEAT repeat protein
MTNVQQLLRNKSSFDIAGLALEDRSIIPELVSILDSRDKFTRSKAASIIAEITLTGMLLTGAKRVGPRLVIPAIPRLIKMLDDSDESARSEAACALGRIAAGEEEVVLVEPAVLVSALPRHGNQD